MLTRRDLLVILATLGTTVGAVLLAEEAVLPQVMGSTAFDWMQIAVRKTPKGESRKFFQAPTATLDELECHVTTLTAGELAHPPHQHPEEELTIVKEGTVEVLVNGAWQRVGPGSVVFQASNQLHSLRNVGDTPATYFAIKWAALGTRKQKGP